MEFKIHNNASCINFSLSKEFSEFNDKKYEFHVDIKSGCLAVSNLIVIVNQKELENFFQKLNVCYEYLNGEVKTNFDYDTALIVKLRFASTGKIGVFCDVLDGIKFENKCHIEIETDQTYIKNTLGQLKKILLNKN